MLPHALTVRDGDGEAVHVVQEREDLGLLRRHGGRGSGVGTGRFDPTGVLDLRHTARRGRAHRTSPPRTHATLADGCAAESGDEPHVARVLAPHKGGAAVPGLTRGRMNQARQRWSLVSSPAGLPRKRSALVGRRRRVAGRTEGTDVLGGSAEWTCNGGVLCEKCSRGSGDGPGSVKRLICCGTARARVCAVLRRWKGPSLPSASARSTWFRLDQDTKPGRLLCLDVTTKSRWLF